jgi:hypothetical protein
LGDASNRLGEGSVCTHGAAVGTAGDEMTRAMNFSRPVGRRRVLRSGLAAAAAVAVPLRAGRSQADDRLRLVPRPGMARLFGEGGPQTGVWCYNGAVPGPEIRARHGSWSRTSCRKTPRSTGMACASRTPWTVCPI